MTEAQAMKQAMRESAASDDFSAEAILRKLQIKVPSVLSDDDCFFHACHDQLVYHDMEYQDLSAYELRLCVVDHMKDIYFCKVGIKKY